MQENNPCRDTKYSRITFCQEYGMKDCNRECYYAKQRDIQGAVKNAIIDIGGVKCCCGCGMEAGQIFNGVPIPNVNPMLHYRTYKKKHDEALNKRFEQMRADAKGLASPLEYFAHPDNFDEIRGQI